METSCTFVANTESISQWVAVGSLLIAAGGIAVLGILRDRRFEASLAEGIIDDPELAPADA